MGKYLRSAYEIETHSHVNMKNTKNKAKIGKVKKTQKKENHDDN